MTREEYIDTNEYGYDENKGIWSKAKEKFLEGNVHPSGYVRVWLKCIDGKQRNFQYHRAMWYLAYGPIPDGYEVNHIREDEAKEYDETFDEKDFYACRKIQKAILESMKK